MPELAVEKVIVHPLVLLSVPTLMLYLIRIGKVGSQKRVVGVLLGSWHKKVLDVSNSFAGEFPNVTYFYNHGPFFDYTLMPFDEIGAEEAEEVDVEHLLRDIKDTTVGTLSQRITNQVHGLKGLNCKLVDIKGYLDKVAAGKLPINHQIIYQLQDVFNLLPDVNLQEFIKAFYLKTNDQMLVVYLASLIRSVVALHNLINNKIPNRDAEKKEGQEKDDSKKEKKEDKEKEKGDTKKDKKDKK
uniref:Proteasome 26S subunit, non-ATPase 7 n=1 Tax=Oncorhynchus kisutch TaxID=8019 RepID=A0A8C7KVP0_ONCKI